MAPLPEKSVTIIVFRWKISVLKTLPREFPVIHQPPPATDTEMLQARENLMETIQAFLKEYDHIPPEEKYMALLLAEERFLKIKQAIEALNLTPSIPFVLEYPSSSPIPGVNSDFLIEEVNTFLVLEDSILPGIESDFDSEGDIIFSNDLLNDDPILEYEHFTFDIEPDAPVINIFDQLNEDECFDPGGGEIDVSQNIEDDDSFAFVIRTFLPYCTCPVDSPLLLSTGSEDTIFDLGIST
ncbi:hypothetical protein Tco_1276314 [Tanacetum coccineum]